MCQSAPGVFGLLERGRLDIHCGGHECAGPVLAVVCGHAGVTRLLRANRECEAEQRSPAIRNHCGGVLRPLGASMRTGEGVPSSSLRLPHDGDAPPLQVLRGTGALGHCHKHAPGGGPGYDPLLHRLPVRHLLPNFERRAFLRTGPRGFRDISTRTAYMLPHDVRRLGLGAHGEHSQGNRHDLVHDLHAPRRHHHAEHVVSDYHGQLHEGEEDIFGCCNAY
mmetsp:Transcript_75560/g.161928  ORF Transcript_75560/g.161928 Transcript_75560/m.161928 type:complete len:221 (+) Transcript_75560:1348-2010(+)